jgi:hypothetical protein
MLDPRKTGKVGDVSRVLGYCVPPGKPWPYRPAEKK